MVKNNKSIKNKSMKNKSIKNIKNTKNIKSKKNKKNKNVLSKYSGENILIFFLELLNNIKICHWKTKSHSIHKATDELYEELDVKIDEFIEFFMGKDGKRINSFKKIIKLNINNFVDLNSFRQYIENSKKYLIEMSNDTNIGNNTNTDLISIRDDILGILNKFTYLLTLK
jgi:DNA-binding ferritin-like protein